ncbi:MAG: VIT1/CCC1 transporter family protein [Mycobacteriales bacterium]
MARAEIHHQHRDVTGGWLRPAVFGVMDGLVSTFALIAGVAGAGTPGRTVAVAGFAGLVAGAFSMATGEYTSVATQAELTRAELAVERTELAARPAAELQELAELYQSRGLDPDLAGRVAEQLSRDPELAWRVHAREELGVDPDALPNPWLAAGSSFASFTVGGLLPLLPYLLGADSLPAATALAAAGLFATGALTARFTARRWLYTGLRQLFVGAAAAAVTFAVGATVGAGIS